MKNQFSISAITLGIILLFTSCNRTEVPTIQTFNSFESIIVDDSFDWNLNREVTITISGVDNEVVKIGDQYDEITFHKAFSKQTVYITTISIPSYIDTISINNQSVAVQDNINHSFFKSTNKNSKSDIAFGEKSTFKNKKSEYIRSVNLDNDRFLIVFQDDKNSNKGSAIIGNYEEDVITFGDISVFNNGYTREMQVCKISPNKVVVAYHDKGDSDNGNAVIGTINGNSISWGSEFIFDDGKVDYVRVVNIDESTVVITYQDEKDSSHGYGIVGTIVGDNISFGAKSKFYNSKSDHIATTALTNGLFVTVIQDDQNQDQGTAVSGQVIGNNISWGSPVVYSTNKTDDPAIESLGNNNFVIAFRDESNQHNGTALVGNADNNILTFGSPSVFNIKKADGISIAAMNNNNFVIAYTDHDNSRKGTVIEGTASGFNLSWNSEIVFNAKTKWSSVIVDENNDIIVSFQDDQDKDQGRSIKTYSVQESDGDGIPDNEDDFPNDPNQAFANSYPADGFGTLGFEDLWPDKGDYDFNDLVVGYRFLGNTNSDNSVSTITAQFVVKATGAGFDNGFGFNLPDATVPISAINVSGYNEPLGSVTTLAANGCEQGQNFITIIPYSKVPYLGNTEVSGTTTVYDTCTITITINGNYSFSDFSFSTFNPFLIVDGNRGREVHLPSPGFPPTILAEDSYFGIGDDDSNPAESKYYKTENNLPWVINIPTDFRYPYEKLDITEGYLRLIEWVQSDGTEYTDWYLDQEGYRNNNNLYPIIE